MTVTTPPQNVARDLPPKAQAIRDKLLAQAQDLSRIFAEEAAASEKRRYPTDRAINALLETDILKALAPKKYGGYAIDLETFYDIGTLLGEGDASLTWVTTFYMEHVWLFALFPLSFQEKIFADGVKILAPAMTNPMAGKAERVEGGYILNGEWEWGSGVMHSSWIQAPAKVYPVPENGQPDLRFFAFKTEDTEIKDVWHMSGMCGTGSNIVIAKDVFVPDEQTIPLLDAFTGHSEGAHIHNDNLFRLPFLVVLPIGVAMPMIGQARMMLRKYQEQLVRRKQYLTDGAKVHAELGPKRVRLADAEFQLLQVDMLMKEVIRQTSERLTDNTETEIDRWSAMMAFAMRQCRDVIESLARNSGASSQKSDSPIQRAVRDATTIMTHYVFDYDLHMDKYAKMVIGDQISAEGNAKAVATEMKPVAIELEAGRLYAYCTCGLSKKQPFCDGEHKGTGFKPFMFKTEETKTAHLCLCRKSSKGPFCDGSHIEK